MSLASIAEVKDKWSEWSDWHERFDRDLRVFIAGVTAYALLAFTVRLPYFDRLDLNAHWRLLSFVGASVRHTAQIIPTTPADQSSPAEYVALVAAATVIAGAYFLIRNRTRSASLLVLSVAGAYALQMALNLLVTPPRDPVSSAWLSGHEFPSVYSTLGVTVYLSVGYLVARTLSRMWQRIAMASGILLAAVTLASTLTVDLPSQAIAGCAAGIAWLALLRPLSVAFLGAEDMWSRPRLVKRFRDVAHRPGRETYITKAWSVLPGRLRSATGPFRPRGHATPVMEGDAATTMAQPVVAPSRIEVPLWMMRLRDRIAAVVQFAAAAPRRKAASAAAGLERRRAVRASRRVTGAEQKRIDREAAAKVAERDRLERQARKVAEDERLRREAEVKAAKKEQLKQEAAREARVKQDIADQKRLQIAAKKTAERGRLKREADAKAAEKQRLTREAATKAAEEARVRKEAEARATEEALAKRKAEAAQRERVKREAEAEAARKELLKRESKAKAAETDRIGREAAKTAQEREKQAAAMHTAEWKRREQDAEPKAAAAFDWTAAAKPGPPASSEHASKDSTPAVTEMTTGAGIPAATQRPKRFAPFGRKPDPSTEEQPEEVRARLDKWTQRRAIGNQKQTRTSGAHAPKVGGPRQAPRTTEVPDKGPSEATDTR